MFRVKGPLWAICIGIGAWMVYARGYTLWLALPFAFALILDGIALAEQAVFEGHSRIRSLAAMSFIKTGGFTLCAFALAWALPELMSVAFFGWLFAAVLIARVAYGWHSWKLLPASGRPTQPESVKSFMMMGAYAFVTVLYFKIDAVMLSFLWGDIETGHYGNAYDFLEGSLFVSGSMAAVLYPKLVQADAATRGAIFDTALRFLMVVAACGIFALCFVAPWLGLVLAGEAFNGAIQPMRILAWGLPFMFANGLMSRWLFAQNRERFALITASLAALFNLIGNAILIPHYGSVGAAATTLATEGLLFFLWIGMGRGSWSILPFWFLTLGIVGLLFTGIIVYDMALWIGFVLAAVIFAPMLWFVSKPLLKS
jgi:O-antigen/teichoic acid export membrane protein